MHILKKIWRKPITEIKILTIQITVKWKQQFFYVAVAYSSGFNPTVVEKFDNKTDADSYAALMCRSKQRRYIVLEQVTEWDGTPQENA